MVKRGFSAIFSLLVIELLLVQTTDAQWLKVNGIGGATVTSFASDSMGLFAGTNSGIIRSTDNGITWSAFNTGITDSNIVALAQDGPNVIAGTYNGSLFLLSDTSTVWESVGHFSSYIRFATAGPLLFAISGEGLVFSADLGATWELNDLAFGNNFPQAIASVSTLLFAGTSHGILFSLDFGTTWQKLADSLLLDADVISLASQGNALFAGTAYNGSSDTAFGGIFRSTDYGNSWTRVYDDLSVQVFSFSTNGANIFAATNHGVLRSTDSGTTWRTINLGLTNKNVRAVTMRRGSLFAGTLWDGIFRSMDTGATWVAGNVGLTGTSPLRLYRTPNALFTIAGYYSSSIQAGLLESTDEGETWTSKNPDTITNIQTFADLGGKYFAGIKKSYGGFSQILTSTDSTPWTPCTSIDSLYDNITLNTFGSNILIGTQDGGVFRSRDTGLTWEAIDSGLGLWPSVYHLAARSDTLFAGTYNGAYWSDDSGNTWFRMDNGLPDSGIFCFAVLQNNIFAGDDGGKGIFHSTDNGESWLSASNGFPDHFSIVTMATNGPNVFAGGSDLNGAGGRIFLSTDFGNSWTDVSIPGDGIVESLATDSVYLFATLDYGAYSSTGVWRRKLSDIIPVSSIFKSVTPTATVWNYPNPFSESTTITFTSELAGNATVSIVNLLGEEVACVYTGIVSAGRHSLVWNNSQHLPAGAYECRIAIGGNKQTFPIMLAQ